MSLEQDQMLVLEVSSKLGLQLTRATRLSKRRQAILKVAINKTQLRFSKGTSQCTLKTAAVWVDIRRHNRHIQHNLSSLHPVWEA
jgi:Na+/phosphate symporter